MSGIFSGACPPLCLQQETLKHLQQYRVRSSFAKRGVLASALYQLFILVLPPYVVSHVGLEPFPCVCCAPQP
jgi:hypothetical protein